MQSVVVRYKWLVGMLVTLTTFHVIHDHSVAICLIELLMVSLLGRYDDLQKLMEDTLREEWLGKSQRGIVISTAIDTGI